MRRCLLLVLVGFLSCALVSAKTIGLSCWIVAEDDGDSQHSPSTITNCVIELNRIFSQVAMEFSLVSIVKTNSSHLANIVFTALQRFVKKSIGDFGQSTGPELIAI